MAKQYVVTYDSYDSWKLPLNLAIGFHLLIAFCLVFLPGMLKPKPKFEDIYTVNLISLAEPAVEQPAVRSEPQPPAPEPEPPAKKEAVAIAEPEQPAAPPKPAEPVSLKPLKRKIKKEVQPQEPKRDPARERELERLRREKIAEALQAEQAAAEEARLAAEMAARQQRALERQLAQMQARNQRPAGNRPSGGSSSTLSILEKQYYTAIINRITQFWALPEYKQWPPDTQAIVVIRINAGGMITKQFFEEQSDDPTFDQFVRKTLQEAAPLPAIPPALRKDSFEIGLRFSPKNIQ